MLIGRDEYDFEDILITEPSENMADKPAWTESFISAEENNVTITKEMNIDWR